MALRVDFPQLMSACDWSISQFETPRKNRLEAIREFCGVHYADGGTEKRNPTNFLELATTIYVRSLASNAPSCTFTAKRPELRSFAALTELALNQLPEEIGLGFTLRRAVLEALFSVGIVKVGLANSDMEILGHDVGEPFADIVTLDDYFCDMSAKHRSQMQFEGNDYWMQVDRARERFNTHKIEPDAHTITGDRGEQRAESVSTDEGADLYKERVWLRDVYLHETGQLVTYGVKTKELYDTIDWDGPENGPYNILGYSDVPGNILPLPPAALWRDLHELGNGLFRKLGRQADAKKSVAAFQGGSDESVNALKQARDGDGIRYEGQKPEMITVGGIDQPTLAMFLTIQDMFDYFAGNLNTLGGLGPTSDTVGQDRLVSEAAGARAKDMSEQTIRFSKGIFKQLAWYEWTDPVRERYIERELYDTGITLPPQVWSDETREGDWLDYNFGVDMFSMQDNSPETQLQKLGLIMQQYIVPLMPVIQAQGGTIDAREILSQVSKLSNFPAVSRFVKFHGMPPTGEVPMQGNPQPSFKPSETHRTYERINRPGATRSGRNNALAQTLLGGNVQPAEQATIGRRVG
jgi:hypothetical protein